MPTSLKTSQYEIYSDDENLRQATNNMPACPLAKLTLVPQSC